MTDEDIKRIRKIITRRVTEAGTRGLNTNALIKTLLRDGVANSEMDIRYTLMSMGVASAKTGVCLNNHRLVFVTEPEPYAPQARIT